MFTMPLPPFFKHREPDVADTSPMDVADVQARTRARRRLIGAAVLLLVGVVSFPLLFESQPRPVAVDTPMVIPSRDGAAPLAAPGKGPGDRSASGAVVMAPPAASASVGEATATGTSGSAGPAGPVTATAPVAAPPGTAPAVGGAVAAAAPTAVAAGTLTPAAPVAAAPVPVAPAKPASAAPPSAPKAEPKPEAKALPAPAPKPEPKTTPAPAPKAEPKPDAKAVPATKSEPPPAPKPPPKPEAKPEIKPEAKSATRVVIQIGAYAEESTVKDVRQRAEKLGFKTFTQEVQTPNGRRIRVRIGPFDNPADAQKALERLKGAKLPGAVLTL